MFRKKRIISPRHIATFLFSLLPFFANGYEFAWFQRTIKSDRIIVLQETGSSFQKNFTPIHRISTNRKSHYDSISPSLDTAGTVSKLKCALQKRIDSLNAKGTPSSSLQQRLDYLNNDSTLSQEKYNELLILEQKVKAHITPSVPALDTLSSIENTLREKVNDIQAATTELGIGPLGDDLKTNNNTSIPGINVPTLPDVSTRNSIPEVNPVDVVSNFPNGSVGDLKNPTGKRSDELGDLQSKAGQLSEVTNQVSGLTKDAGYAGMIPGLNTVAGIVEAGAAIAAGDYWGAAFAAGTAVPVLGSGLRWGKLVIQAHHVIPRALIRNFNLVTKVPGFLTDGLRNIKRIAFPFHGNHPAYSRYVQQQLQYLEDYGRLNIKEIEKLQNRIKKQKGIRCT